MRAVLVGLVAAVLASSFACGGAKPASREPTQLTEDQARRADDYEDENSVGLPEPRLSRWRWKGDRKRCFFIVGNRCFDDERAACEAAKCDAGCAFDRDLAPVRVSCRD